MSASFVLGTTGAVALYLYLRAKYQPMADLDELRAVQTAESVLNLEHAPNTWTEAVHHMNEVLR